MKKCTTCGEEKELDYFYNDKKSKDGRCHSCKKCMNIVSARNSAKKRKPRPDWKSKDGFKICRKCLIEKPINEFNVHYGKTRTKDKLRNECKECQRLHSKEHYVKVRDVWNKKRRDLRTDPSEIAKRHHHHLKRKFGITGADYEKMLKSQDGKCTICGSTKPGINGNVIKKFAVDHDHKTGKIRTLLCANCNQGLGNFKDSPTLLRQAAEYLDSFNNSI